MSDVFDFLTKWVRKNITPNTAHIRDDTLTAGRLAEECLWEAQAENLSAAAKTKLLLSGSALRSLSWVSSCRPRLPSLSASR